MKLIKYISVITLLLSFLAGSGSEIAAKQIDGAGKAADKYTIWEADAASEVQSPEIKTLYKRKILLKAFALLNFAEKYIPSNRSAWESPVALQTFTQTARAYPFLETRFSTSI